MGGEVDNNISKLKSSNACVSCNLNRTYLSKSNFREVDLSGASLSSANLSETKLCRTIMPNGFTDNSGC